LFPSHDREEGVYEANLNEELTTNGVIDRVEQGDAGGLLVIDYKTSKREKSRIELYQDDQLKGYVHACSQKYNVPVDKIFAGHYYPLTNNFVYVKYSKVQIAAFVKSRINKIWEIRKAKKEDLVPSRNQFCNWCSYQTVCPEYNSNKICEERIQALRESKKDQEQ
jgi:putative RecB family exonuclease